MMHHPPRLMMKSTDLLKVPVMPRCLRLLRGLMVALPAACGVDMILQGKIQAKGVYIPVIPEIYNPILDQLETMDIKMVEDYGLPMSDNIK